MSSTKITLFITLLASLSLSETNVVTIKQVTDAVNEIRANPKKYAGLIQTLYLDKMNANNIHTEWSRSFYEGRTAIDEAIAYLNNATPVAAMEVDMSATHCAWKHSIYQNSINNMTHDGVGEN